MTDIQTSLKPAGTIDAAAILALDDILTEDVPVKAWGCHVRVRQLTVGEIESIQQHAQVPDGKGGTRLNPTIQNQELFAAAVVAPPFTLAQVKALWGHSAEPVGTVMAAIRRLTNEGREAEAIADATRAFPETADEAPAV